MKPLFEHDCPDCIFLGIYEGKKYLISSETIKADLYYCPNEPTIIARYSSDGPDYSSGICFANVNLALKEALNRANSTPQFL